MKPAILRCHGDRSSQAPPGRRLAGNGCGPDDRRIWIPGDTLLPQIVYPFTERVLKRHKRRWKGLFSGPAQFKHHRLSNYISLFGISSILSHFTLRVSSTKASKMQYSAVLLLLASTAIATPLLPRGEPNFSISGLNFGGSGCPVSSASSVNPKTGLVSGTSNIRVSISSNTYDASIGPSTPLIESRKNCQILLEIRAPSGWSYSPATATYRGDLKLDEGVTALQKATYYYPGETNQVDTQQKFVGKRAGKWSVTENVPELWSACGSQNGLSVNTQVRLDGKEGTSGSISGERGGVVEIELGLKWRKC